MLITCFNHLSVIGPAKEILRFVNATTGRPYNWTNFQPEFDAQRNLITPSEYFCFNAFLPVPDDIIRSERNAAIPETLLALSDRKLKRRYTSVSEWCKDYWGSGWDIWEQKITPKQMGYTEGCEQLEIAFESHRIPTFWLESVFREFPELIFHNLYFIRGQFACGDIYGYRGEYFLSEVEVEPAKEVFGTGEEISMGLEDAWWKEIFPDPDCPF